ncbi:MAG: HAD family hydrolase [Polyangiales bacterium]
MTVRIAMWSGPRTLSTALMRSFGARPDTAVVDEPFYAAYLARTGLAHPLREAVLASQPHDPAEVTRALLGPVPGDKAIFYQKHMTHHMLDGFDLGWMDHVRSAFLVRAPEPMLASYTRSRAEVTLADLGFAQQRTLFEREAARLGSPPPVIDSADLAADPAGTLARLCGALGLAYSDVMLRWPAGPRNTDGAWAPAWYAAVEHSTGFVPRVDDEPPALPAPLARVAEAARPHFEAVAAYCLRPPASA